VLLLLAELEINLQLGLFADYWYVIFFLVGLIFIVSVSIIKYILAFFAGVFFATSLAAVFNLSFETKDISISEELDSDYSEATFTADLSLGQFSFTDLPRRSDNLIDITGESSFVEYSIDTEGRDPVGVNLITDERFTLNLFSGANSIDIGMTRELPWEISTELDLSEVVFDLEDTEIDRLDITADLSTITVKLGEQDTDSELSINSSLSDINLELPSSMGIEIVYDIGLSDISLDGFEKVADGEYRSRNFDSADSTITINLDADMTDIDIEIY
jgi:hypothetical protein